LEGEAKLKKIPKQEYTPEFRELSVKRVKAGQSIGTVARELGLIEQTLRNWVKAAAAGKLNGPGSKVVTPEQMELSRVRAENIRLKRENEILKNRPRGLPRPICIETERRLDCGHAETVADCFLEASSPSKSLAQGKLRTQLWWHHP
jgi:transposase